MATHLGGSIWPPIEVLRRNQPAMLRRGARVGCTSCGISSLMNSARVPAREGNPSLQFLLKARDCIGRIGKVGPAMSMLSGSHAQRQCRLASLLRSEYYK